VRNVPERLRFQLCYLQSEGICKEGEGEGRDGGNVGHRRNFLFVASPAKCSVGIMLMLKKKREREGERERERGTDFSVRVDC